MCGRQTTRAFGPSSSRSAAGSSSCTRGDRAPALPAGLGALARHRGARRSAGAAGLRRGAGTLAIRPGIPPRWDWVDPLKDIQAQVLAIDAGLLSRRKAVEATGYDIEEIDRENAADAERASGLGLTGSSQIQP